jgi:hypothetical protein
MALAEAMNCSVQELQETDAALVAEIRLTVLADQRAPGYYRKTEGDDTVH